ncbi:MAG: radical SAM protein [Thermoplasmata archaeon]|nr:radical SAM protein [Thermoplasmata archaeon]
MSHAYGPVPSRRFGRSIGVSPIPPKACSYSCVYCQLGRTTDLRIKRASFFPVEDIISDIEKLVSVQGSNTDFITIVGDGEPTLSQDIGKIISFCKQETSIPVAVITNGSLLWHPDVRHDLMNADVVSITLSAGDVETYQRLHRPHRDLDFESVLDGMIIFSKEFRGELWAEVMMVAGINDSESALHSTKNQLDLISPKKIFIATPTRPPAEDWVKPPESDTVLNAASILGGSLEMTFPEIGDFSVVEGQDHVDTILQLCSRHPMMEKQVRDMEGRFEDKVVDNMVLRGLVEWKTYMGVKYLIPVRKKIQRGQNT